MIMNLAHLSHLHTIMIIFVSKTKKLVNGLYQLLSHPMYETFLNDYDELLARQGLDFMLAENTATEIGDHITTSPFLVTNHAIAGKLTKDAIHKDTPAVHPA